MRLTSGPKLGLIIHGAMVVFWTAMLWPSVTVWRDSVPYLVFLSVYALISSHLAAAQSALGAIAERRHHKERKNESPE